MSEPQIPGGAILIARKIVESQIWQKPPLYLKVWIYLLTLAQHKDYKGLHRGSLRTSIPEIIEECKWRVGARYERPTKDQVYQILEWLRKPNEGGHESNAKATMITTTKATHGMLIFIDNYGFYQDLQNYESNDESNDEKATKALRKQRQPDNINKNVNNDNNVQEDLKRVTPNSPKKTARRKKKKSEESEDTSMGKQKIKFLDTVFLTQDEYDRLVNDFGKDEVDLWIAKLDEWQTNYPKKARKDHNKTIRVWIRTEAAKRKQLQPTRQQRNQDQMDVLKNFYEEGRSVEENGNSSVYGRGQNSLPSL